MAEAGLAYQALEAIAVTLGPGGFTGVRIGLATARALALASARPLIGISNFEVVAAAVPENERQDRVLAVLIDAKRAELFAQAFTADLTPHGDAPHGDARALSPEALDAFLPSGPLILAGDAVAQARPALDAAGREYVVASSPGPADAAWLARLAARRPLPAPDGPPAQAIYLRAPDVTLPRERNRKTAKIGDRVQSGQRP